MRPLIAALTVCLATSSFAASPASDLKMADQTLNQTYQRIIKRLSDDNDGRSRLVKAQKAWVAFRDAECTFQSSGDDGGTAAPMVAAQCQATLTQQRTKQLKAYLNCQEGDLSCPVPAQ